MTAIRPPKNKGLGWISGMGGRKGDPVDPGPEVPPRPSGAQGHTQEWLECFCPRRSSEERARHRRLYQGCRSAPLAPVSPFTRQHVFQPPGFNENLLPLRHLGAVWLGGLFTAPGDGGSRPSSLQFGPLLSSTPAMWLRPPSPHLSGQGSKVTPGSSSR